MAKENANDGDYVRWSIGLKIPRPWASTVVLAIGLTLIIALHSFVRCESACSQFFATQVQEINLVWIWVSFPVPILGVYALWLANKRFKQTDSLIKLQISLQNQQRFFDGIKLVESDTEPVQLAGLEAIRQAASVDGFEFQSEAFAFLKRYLEQHGEEAVWKDETLGVAKGNQGVLRIVKHAFLALASLDQKRDPEGRKLDSKRPIVGLSLAGLSVEYNLQLRDRARIEQRVRINNIEFRGCDLRNCRFAGVVFKNVNFIGNPRTNIHSTDLTDTSFLFAKFESVSFSTSNISGADFGASRGLSKNALTGCIYAFGNPPKNLPKDFILKYPSFGFVLDKDFNHVRKQLDASCIPDFCKKHEGFEPYGDDKVITT